MSVNAHTRRRRHRGYTLVEVMVTLALLTIGILATMALQSGTIGASATSQDHTYAKQLAVRMLEVTRVDALSWIQSTNFANTRFLKTPLPAITSLGLPSPGVPNTTGWTAVPIEGEAFERMPVDRDFRPDTTGTPAWPVGFRYCIHFRLAWAQVNDILRVDVRVSWPFQNVKTGTISDCKKLGEDPSFIDVTQVNANLRTLTLSGLVMRNALASGS